MDYKGIKIIIVAQTPPTKRLLQDLCMDELAQWFDLEFLDVSSILTDEIPVTVDILERSYAIKVNTYQDLKLRLKELHRDTLVILYTFKQSSTFKLHKVVADYIETLVIVEDNSSFYGECVNGETMLHKAKDVDKVTQKKENTTKLRLKRILYKYEPLQYILKYIRYRGDNRYELWKVMHQRARCIEVFKHVYYVGMANWADYVTCSPHYTNILKLENSEGFIKKPYIVFLDAAYPVHPDYKNYYPDFDWDRVLTDYMSSVNSFLDKIEKQYQCEVVIALHPSANYEGNPYGNRECYKYKTVELVKEAKAVLMQAGGSITFVAYYDKPLCFLTNEASRAGDFLRSLHKVTNRMAQELNIPLIDTDNIDSVKGVFKRIEPTLRKQFLDLYMGDLSQKIPYAEQLRNAIAAVYSKVKTQK